MGSEMCIRDRYSEAEPLYERCQKIEEKVLGPEHPSLATTLGNRASLLQHQVRGDVTFSWWCIDMWTTLLMWWGGRVVLCANVE